MFNMYFRILGSHFNFLALPGTLLILGKFVFLSLPSPLIVLSHPIVLSTHNVHRLIFWFVLLCFVFCRVLYPKVMPQRSSSRVYS